MSGKLGMVCRKSRNAQKEQIYAKLLKLLLFVHILCLTGDYGNFCVPSAVPGLSRKLM
jgi:hypothetical protein